MRYLKLLGASFSLSLRQEMAFRTNLFFQVLMTIMSIVSGLAVLGAVYAQTQTLAGWNLGESVVLLGTFQVIGGIFQTFITPNLNWFAGKVKDGTLDSILMQPISSLYMASLGKCAPLVLTQVATGLLVVLLGLRELGILPTLWGLLSWLILAAMGVIVAWATRALFSSLAFWAPSVELGVFYDALWQFGRYPVTIYPQPLRFLLTYVLPFAFIATFPTSALLDRTDPRLPILGLVISAFALTLAHLVWHAGLRRYTSATS
ncbi:ABC transporter permease [Dictyobacter sp. S3.2.2.5]|uniref:ABC transporter permease n=1 Tax=Dictyobacter halimunensis TaxID=3026934 RepID=A0ABQ6FNP3_9CHLR|nr:ABC transporter permease [Dictyobacter sp. S3.2.2.5]